MKRVACYVRVSTDEQRKHGLSVDNQIKALTKYCKDNNYQIAGIYNDAGISARKRYTKRPALLKMIDDCKSNKIDLIIITKLDRFFRSVADYYAVMDQINVPWRAIWEDYETETSSGIFKVNIMLSVAQSEADRTSERIKSTMEYKRAKGDYLGNNVTGYIRTNKKLIIDPKQQPYVRAFFDKYIETNNITESLRILHNAGINVTGQTAHRMLRNTVYKGIATCGHKCEPYLTEDEWNYIQNIIPVVNRKSTNNDIYLFTGLVKCHECGNNLTGCKYTAPSTKVKYKYYRCKTVYNRLSCNNRKMLSEKKIESYLLESLDTLIGDREIINAQSESKHADAKKKISQLEEKIKRIGDRYEEGEITREEYKNKINVLNAELRELRSKTIESIPKSIELPHHWKDIYNELNTEKKRTFWGSIIKSIVVEPDNEIKVYFL